MYEHLELIDVYHEVILLPLSIINFKNLKCIKIHGTYNGLDLSLFENLTSITISNEVEVIPKQLLIQSRQKLTSIVLYDFYFNCSNKVASDTWCLLNGADPVQCADNTPVLHSIQYIELRWVTCSSAWLRSLFGKLLTLDHEVECELKWCEITSCVEGAVSESSTSISATITTGLNDTITIKAYGDSAGLWETLHGLNVKKLSLFGRFDHYLVCT
ncbi:hypothetical protein DPMN_057230 [Dreissena polymorpha]|uniref:Uncharacterized protein n=1 Tax=Dreissena polymorpha TaxID=45954 RepID=A0A9D4CU18_DREPO|nr:hypothetical protein DPMN_057230 [Dreissena polymorpha]